MEVKTDEDIILRCKSCGLCYVLQPGEARWLLAKQLSLPTHCPACRQKRRGQAKDCETCFHLINGLCDCREPEDMSKEDCPDWRPK